MADNVAITAGAGTTIATDDVAGVQYQQVKIDVGGDGASLPLSTTNPIPVALPAATVTTLTPPAAITGFATETTLGTVHGHIDSMDTKTPALGQALAAASVPVILPSATVTTLTPPAAITGFATAAKQLADGHTVALSATDNAVLDTIDTAIDAINTKLATGTVIGDVNLGATDNAVLDTIATNTTRVAITDYGQARLDDADVTTAQAFDVGAAATANKKFYITSIILSVTAAGSYWIEDDDAAQITCKFTLAANGGVSWSAPIDTPYKSTTVNKGLKVKGSSAGVIGCLITYYLAA